MKRVTSLLIVLLLWLSSATYAQPGTVELGTGTASNGTTASPTPYGTYYKNLRQQYLVLASELSSIGLVAGDITAIGFNVANVNTCSAMPNYTMKVKATTASVLTTTFDNEGYTEVWFDQNFLPVNGWNTHTFGSPFTWDGTSNLLLDVCFDIIPGSYSQNASVFYTPTATNLSLFYRSDSYIACGTTNAGTLSLNRANMQFTGVVAGCLPPTGIVAGDITSNSALISWTAGTASQWDVLYGIAGFNPLTQGTLVEGITSPSYSVTGLSSSTFYDVYVRADCGAEVSSWGGPVNFLTACGVYTLPFAENFDGTTFPSLCWTRFTGLLEPTSILTATTAGWVKDEWLNVASNPDKAARVNIYGTTHKYWLVTPEIDLGDGSTDYQMEFDLALMAYGNNNPPALTGVDDKFAVVISLDGGVSWSSANTVQLWDSAGPTYVFNEISNLGQRVIISLADYSGIVKLAFYAESTISNADNDLMVNNLIIRTPPDCLEPSVLIAQNPTINSIDLSWTPGGDETAWEISYGTPGFDPNTGTIVPAATNPFTHTGLTANTSYGVYVRADCGTDEVSDWAGPGAFTTLCEPTDLPYIEDFESAIVPNLPPCTSREKIGLGNDWATAAAPGYGFTSKTLRYSYNTSYAADAWFYTNGMNLSEGVNYLLSFRYGNNSTGYVEKMKVALGTDATHTAMTNVILDFPSINQGSPQIVDYTFTVPAAGVYYLGFNCYSGINEYYLYVDDIAVEEFVAGSLSGIVTEATRGVIQGALVTAGTNEAYTDASGYYLFDALLPGTYDVTCEAEGYFPVTADSIEIVANQTTTQNFTLGYATITVAPESLTQTLLPGGTATQMLTISNTGGTEPLAWSAGIQMVDPPKSSFLNTKQEKINHDASAYDKDPNPSHSNPVQTDAMYDLLGSFPLFDVGGTYSSATDGNFIYTGRWNLNQYDKYELDGTHIESFSIPGAGLTRDLTYDGQYFYGSPNSDLIYQMDFETQTLVSTIVASGNSIRGIAYDSDDDAFWVTGSSFSGPFRQISREGTVLQTVTTTLGGMSGLAYDNVSPDGPYLWAYTPSTSTGEHIINKINLANGSVIESFDVTTTGISVLPGGTSGGLNITNQIVPGKWVIMGVVQNEIAWILELADSQSWIALDITSGVILPGASQEITVTFDATDLVDSTYLANINIKHNGQELMDGTLAVPASLTVASTTPPDAPTLVSPTNVATFVPLQPEFEWINGAGTAQVRIVVRRGVGGFANVIHTSQWFTGNTFALADVEKTLDPKVKHTWFVQAKNAAGTVDSPKWTFTTIGAGTVNGLVSDAFSALPLEGAAITLAPGGYTAITATDGTYSITGVLEGTYTVTAEMDGYVSASQEITVAHNQTAPASFALNLFLAPPKNLQAQIVDVTDVHVSWTSPATVSPTELYELSYHLNTPLNSYYESWDYGYGVVYDVSGFTNVTIEKADYHHASWGLTGIWDYKLHVVDWDTYTLLYSTPVLQTTGDDKWEVNIPLNSISESGLVGIFFEPMGNTAADAYPNISSDNNATSTNSFYGPISSFSGMIGSTIGNFLMDLWIMAAPLDGGERVLVQAPIIQGAAIASHPSKVAPGTVSTQIATKEYVGANRALTGFNVYRNGTLLTTTAADVTEFDDLDLAAGTYAYTVKAVYPQGLSEAVGPKTVSILAPPTLLSAEADYYGVDLVWEDGTNYPANLDANVNYSVSNIKDDQALTEKENQLHGPTTIVPTANGSREVGDDCDNPIIITTLPYTDVNYTCERGNTYENTCLQPYYDTGEDIIYQLTLTAAATIELDLATVTGYTGMLITTENPIGNNCIAFVTGYSGNKNMLVELEAGTYFIMIDTWAAPDCIPEFTLTVQEITPEPGQTCGAAVTAVEGLNSAPMQPYWYEFTPTENKAVTISSCMEGQLIDTKIEVYDACGGNLVAANDDMYAECSYYNYASGVSFNAAAGVSYKIFWLNPYSSAAFDFTIELDDLCVVECPAGGISEGEPCGEDLNGGCNSEVPAYTPIASGDVICGTAFADGATRDTDWYELVLDASKTITWTATAEFPVLIFIVDAKSGDCSDYVILSNTTAAPCETAMLTATVAPGTYWLLVMPSAFDGVQCGVNSNYVAELTTEDAFIAYYNVFRDDVDIADVYTGKTYRDEDIVNGEEYCYTVSKVVTAAFETAQSNELCATVPLIPEISVNPESFNKSLYFGTSDVETLTIENTGAGNLEWTANILFAAKDSRVSIPAFTGDISNSEVSMGRAPYTNQKPAIGGDFDVLRGSTAYAFDMYPGYAYINFDTDAPGTYTLNAATAQTVFAADFDGNNVFYAIDNDDATLNTVDLTTGAFTLVASTLALTDLAFDYTSNTMYAVNYDGVSNTLLYTLNLATGATTLVGDCGAGLFISLACDGWGNLYGFNISDDALYSINKLTGAGTLIGSVGFDGNYAQSMAWDPTSDNIYMSAYNSTSGQGELRVVDKTTGASTLVGAFPGGGEVCGLGFMADMTTPWLVLNPEAGMVGSMGSADVEVTFDASNLEVGIYTANIKITSNDPLAPVVIVPVELEVYADLGTISGYVTDATTRGPVQGVLITADELRYSTTTDEDGYYELEVLAGNYLIAAYKAGYISQTAEVTVPTDGIVTQNFMLEFAAPVLLYANGGIGEINLGWTGNPAVDGDNAVRYSTSNVETNRAIDKKEPTHGMTSIVPMVTSGREVGDDCDNPIVLDMTTLPVVDVNTTCGRGNNYTETCLLSYDSGEDIVYQFTLTEAKDLKITLTTVTTWTGILITQECPIAMNCVTWITGSGANKVLTASLEAGTYFMMIDTYASPDCIPDFTLEISEFFPEPGETCATALDYGNVNDEAALGAIETMGVVWYSFTADQNYGSVDVSLCGSSFDTKLEVWYNCSDATYAYYNDDSQVCNAKAAQSFITTGPMQAGQTWYAKVYAYSSYFGDYILEITGTEACNLEMPAGAIAEGEPCIEDEGEDVTNGGCNMAEPMFTTINCGDVIWGSASTYLVGTAKNRDTDWYELVITEPKTVTFSVTAEFPSVAGIVEQTVPGVAGCENITGSIFPAALADPCEEASVTATLIPGTYYFFVGISVFEGYPCGMSNNYIAELTCDEAFVTYYDVFRDDAFLAQTYLETYTDTEVLPDVEYCYTIRQFIEPDVVTPQSNELCASVLCGVGCDYTMTLTDSYGDGWNGASYTIMQGETEIGTYTLASGATANVVVTLCDAMETSFIWNAGPYDSEAGFELFDTEGNSLYSFVAGEAPLNEVVFFTFITECPAPLSQDILLTEGWNAWSSYITPAAPANVSDVMATVVGDMIITQHFNELLYPGYGINTMGAFSNNHGYMTKMAAERTLTVSGPMANPTVQLNTGWNLIPVLQECTELADGVFSNIDGFVIAYEPTGNGIYYPELNIYTLTTLTPGKAYYVKVTEAGTFTYPGCDKSSGNVFSAPLRAANTTSWNDPTYTGVNHVVVFDQKATNNLRIGDMIGAFANGSVCAGLVEYTGANLGFTLFGNDITTMANEGFAEGDVMTYKVFRAETGEEFTMDVVYSLDAPNSSTFVTNGLSVITDLKLAPVSIGENTLKNLSIYPNPSSGIFNIAVSGLDKQIDYVVMNAQGQEVYNGNLMESQQLDLSSEAKGVYFIKFIGQSVLRVEKLVIR